MKRIKEIIACIDRTGETLIALHRYVLHNGFTSEGILRQKENKLRLRIRKTLVDQERLIGLIRESLGEYDNETTSRS